MIPLSLIPLPYKLAAAAFGVALAVGAVTMKIHRYGNGREAVGYARGHLEFTDLQAEMTRRALVADAAARIEEARRTAAQKEIENANEAELVRVRADAAIADASSGRLRQRVAALIAAARSGGSPGNSAPVGAIAPADGAGVLLAELFRRTDERAGQLARYADEARAAGQSCERSYDSLTSQ